MPEPAYGHFNRRAGEYATASQRGLWAVWRRRECAAIFSLLQPGKGERILDAGCGAGYYAGELLALQVDTFATDVLHGMTRQLRQRLPQLPVFVGDLHRLPVRPVFDAVLSAGALEFCARPAVALRSLARCLRRGGRLVVMLPSQSLPGRLYRLYHRRNGLEIHLFTRSWLARAGRRVGLRLDAIRSVGFNFVVRYIREEKGTRS